MQLHLKNKCTRILFQVKLHLNWVICIGRLRPRWNLPNNKMAIGGWLLSMVSTKPILLKPHIREKSKFDDKIFESSFPLGDYSLGIYVFIDD
jgi:hypothetical protein